MAKYIIDGGKELRIALSGKSGCGNTTVSTILSNLLGIPLINYTFRQLSRERGMTLAEVIAAAKTDDSYDKYVDTHQVELARRSSCVLGSRLAIWMLREADFKVYLLADDDTRVMRIHTREGGSENDIRAFTAMRDREDTARYKALYGIVNNDYSSVADMVIDTKLLTAEGVANQVIGALLNRSLLRR